MEVIRCYRDRFLEIGSLSLINSIYPELKKTERMPEPQLFTPACKYFFIINCFHSILYLIALWMLLKRYIDASGHLYSYDMKTEVRLGKELLGRDKEGLTGWAQSEDMTVFYTAHHVQWCGTHLIHAPYIPCACLLSLSNMSSMLPASVLASLSDGLWTRCVRPQKAKPQQHFPWSLVSNM